ncbi:hypothetical protein SIID45300_01757 [Candidatus Magnetaquicoccaceae bacterium FCR-1]|uniref:Uncharacterized protein n=1 Tax=Candidatus Magnetaquiglobus chichijimensis TaxID=3141448 RepID=A0ABQ0C965_9PROT
MFNRQQIENEVIAKACQILDMDSPAARALLLGTMAQESVFGTYVRQMGGGPALGVFQMEPATFHDILHNWLNYQPNIAARLRAVWPELPGPERLVTDLLFAAVMCRLHYRRKTDPLPAADDIPGLARYWKLHYNTLLGKGTEDEFVASFNRYVKGEVKK